MKVLVSGSRKWLAQLPIEQALKLLPPYTILIHGDAAGVDRIAADVAKRLGFIVRAYPALANGRQWPWAGVVRNQEMLDKEHPGEDGLFIDKALLFHEDPLLGKGTKDMRDRLLVANPSIEIIIQIGRGR